MIQTYKQITKQVHKKQQTNMGEKKTEIKNSYKIFKNKTNTQTKKKQQQQQNCKSMKMWKKKYETSQKKNWINLSSNGVLIWIINISIEINHTS